MLVLCAKQLVVSKMCALYALQYEYSYCIRLILQVPSDIDQLSMTLQQKFQLLSVFTNQLTLQLNLLSTDTFLLLLKHKLTNIYYSNQLFLLLKFLFLPALTLSVAALRLILCVFSGSYTSKHFRHSHSTSQMQKN